MATPLCHSLVPASLEAAFILAEDRNLPADRQARMMLIKLINIDKIRFNLP